jgi:uncharacterized RDD family membrane protein YckC
VLNLALAPWWKRLVAVMIDGAVMVIPYIAIVTVIAVLGRNSGHSSSKSAQSAGDVVIGIVLLTVAAAIPYVLYAGIMNGSRRGQTVGKMALSIAVRDARTGGPIGVWRGLARYAITVVFELFLIIPCLIDNLAPLWDGRRQAWHDKVVHSVVVDLNP